MAGSDRDQLHAVGHAILALVQAAILLAILAVILAPGSQAANAIQAFFALLAWLVGQVLRPLTPGNRVQLSDQSLPAGSYPWIGSGGAAGGAGTTSPAGTGTGAMPQNGTVPGGQVAVRNVCYDDTGQWAGKNTVGYESYIQPGTHLC